MASSTPTTGKRAVVWFRNDLRLRDNEALSSVVLKVKAGEVADVVPVYIFDPRFFKASPWGHVKTGAHRCVFYFPVDGCVGGALSQVIVWCTLHTFLRSVASTQLPLTGPPLSTPPPPHPNPLTPIDTPQRKGRVSPGVCLSPQGLPA